MFIQEYELEKNKYRIILKGQSTMVLVGNIPTYEKAVIRLKEMIKTDKELQKYYHWNKLPEYEIIKGE